MNIKHSIGLNLSADAIPGRLHMVQGDANSRTIVATLWDGAQLYSIPAGAAIMVRFRKPDGTGGLYDATESGNQVSYAGSIVTAPVATQMLAVAGDVFAEIDIFGSGSGAAAERLATFRFVVEVAPCVLPDAKIISSDYYNILASKVAEAIAAAERAEQAQSAAATSAEAAATSAANAATSVEGAVKYNAPQTLTDAQKQQARDNIGAPAPYTSGENISISGSVIATKAFPCNPNLLDNWYFGNPVDQRNGYVVPPQTPYFTLSATEWNQVGVTEGYYAITGTNSGGEAYTISIGGTTYMVTKSAAVRGYTGGGYGIDRWLTQTPWGKSGETVTVEDGCIKLASVAVPEYPTSYGRWQQIIEAKATLVGKVVTAAIFVESVVSGDGPGVFFGVGDSATAASGNEVQITAPGVYAVTKSWTEAVDRVYVRVSRGATTPAEVSIRAIKLELGPQQTFAHQENGVWVLNEIPDYGEQLRRCQRYYIEGDAIAVFCRDRVWAVPCPISMRVAPSVQYSNVISYRDGFKMTVTEYFTSRTTLLPGFAAERTDPTDACALVHYSASADL